MFGRYGIIKECLDKRKNVVCVFQNLDELKRIVPIVKSLIKQNWNYEIDGYEDLLLSEMAWASMRINNIFVVLMTKAQYDCRPPEDIGTYTLARLHPYQTHNKQNASYPNPPRRFGY